MLFFQAGSKPHSAPQVSRELVSPKAPPSGGYAEQYQRQKKKQDYKMYTIDDYRRLNKETKMNLGTLGPDLENNSHKERVSYIHLHCSRMRLARCSDLLSVDKAKQGRPFHSVKILL